MKKTIQFSKFFVPAAAISIALVVFSISGYIMKDGFALGVDFQAGHILEVKIAPTAFNVHWNGNANARLEYESNRMTNELTNITVIVSGAGEESRAHIFPFSEHNTIGKLKNAMEQEVEGLTVTLSANENVNPLHLVFPVGNSQELSGAYPYVVHHVPQDSIIDISEVREAMADFDKGGISVQSLGSPNDRHFMVRAENKGEEIADAHSIVAAEIVQTLENSFEKGNVAVIRSDYVGSRFSKDLTDQAGMLISLTLLLILIYSAIRFKLQFAVGAVIAIIYDGLVMIAFMVWTQMEFTTLSIAAILTILGYSTNNTIIFFDRVRENQRIYPDNSFIDILNISLTGILGRTIITTASTMLAVLALFIFTAGSMKDFALALMVGMLSGVYTTLFIVSGFVNFWQNLRNKRAKKKQAIG